MKKKELGQYFTTNAIKIFSLKPFLEWYHRHDLYKYIALEPFIGNEDLPKAFNELYELKLINHKQVFKGYDLDPKQTYIIKQDTILDFPKGFDLVITNPPYLYKSVSQKNKLKYDFSQKDFKNFDDLYELALNEILKNSIFSALIIPESFISSQKEFLKEKCEIIISLTIKDLFNDTEHPVCLALFNNQKSNSDLLVYRNNELLGNLKDLKIKKEKILFQKNNFTFKFNDVNGNIDLSCNDNIYNSQGIYASYIPFIDDNKIKSSSRSKTRISIYKNQQKIDDVNTIKMLVDNFNKKLKEYREETYDVFLSPFKGIRKDLKYRRRLDFKTVKDIFNSI